MSQALIDAYLSELTAGLAQLDRNAIQQVIDALSDAWHRRCSVFLLGNGGSAATASHIAVDLQKLAVPGPTRFRAIGLADNVPILTAWANDTTYDNVFAEQLRNLCQPGDVVLAISCSGNSRNVIKAIHAARELGARIIGWTGDRGGELASLVDICVYAPVGLIGQQEDIHMVLDHLITNILCHNLSSETATNIGQVKAFILAAGEGTRLRPLTLNTPKPMLPVAGRPVLTHIIEWLRGYGLRDVAINLHHRPQSVADYFGDGSDMGMRITYSYEDPILGTAGAVRKLDGFVGDSPLVVAYGDVLTDLNLGALLAYHARKRETDPNTGVTMSLYHVDNPTEVGLVGVDDDGRITRFVEKPRPEEVFTDLASAGILILEPGVIGHIPPETFFDFGRDLFPLLLKAGVSMYGWIAPKGTYVLDIGTRDKYDRAKREWPARLQPAVRN